MPHFQAFKQALLAIKMATQVMTELQILEPRNSAASALVPAPSRTSFELSVEPRPTSTTRDDETPAILPKGRSIAVIGYLVSLNIFSSFCNGVIVVGLPTIASALQLEEGLRLWPTSVYYLTAGSCLLLAGSISDVAGVKRVNLVGSFLSAIFAIAFGLSRTSGELIAFRALQGVANAIFVPSSVSIVSNNVEDGRPRNIGFSCLGFSQPIGFSIGLVLGGVFVDTVGWRVPFYLAGAVIFASFLIGIWVLPRDVDVRTGESVWKRLASEIDWIGALIASTGLATLSYVLA